MLLVAANAAERAEITRALRIEFPQARIEAVTDMDHFDAVEDFDDFALAVTAWDLSWAEGIEIVGTIKSLDPDCPVLVVANGDEPHDSTVERDAMTAGADRCLCLSDAPALRAAAREMARGAVQASVPM